MFDAQAFVKAIDEHGYVLVERAIPAEFVSRARPELERAIALEVQYHRRTSYPDYGMVMVCSLYGGSFLEIFDLPGVSEGFNAVLGVGCIVYAYTSSSMPPGGTNYSHWIHVDCPRLIPGYRTNFGAMFLLDDFTEANGATRYLSGSHRRPEAPSSEEFFRDARRLVAPAGSIFFFDPRLWHSGEINRTGQWRHALTVNVCRPWMKQRLDIPRLMAGMDLSAMSDRARQKLGFLAQVPASYEEYYAPAGLRVFRQKTE